MSSILKVSEIQDPTNGNTALAIDSTGDITTLKAPGSVIQAHTLGHGSNVTTTGSSYVDTGLTGSITPKFNNSLILIIVSANVSTSGSNGNEVANRLYRSAPTTATVQEIQRMLLLYETSGGNHQGTYHAGVTMFDTPATTSTCTYKWQHKVISGGGETRHNDHSVSGVPTNQSRMILMEIAQ